MTTIILGTMWGDEGKGKVSHAIKKYYQGRSIGFNDHQLTDHLLAKDSFDVCGRAQGGHNAGHSVHTGGQSYSFHLLPSGLMSPEVDNIIGSGVVFSAEAFFQELSQLEAQGVQRVHERIHISSQCHVNFTLHAAVDRAAEHELGTNHLGTTKNGIGPAYASKASRDGVRVIDLYNETFEQRLRSLAEGYRKRYGQLLEYSVEDEIERFKSYKGELRPYVIDSVNYMKSVRENKRRLLVEASQALMLDVDFGTFPFVTSTPCSVGGCIQGLGLDLFDIKSVIGVVKAYTTRVGSGPFPSECLDSNVGKTLQEIGKEVGVSTGRRRRCGWLDLVVLRYSNEINRYTSLNLTKIDVLDTFPTIKVAVAYVTPAGDELTMWSNRIGIDADRCTLKYVDFEGWQSSTKGVRTWSQLPSQAQKYVEFIESEVGTKIVYIGTGPDREDMIIRE